MCIFKHLENDLPYAQKWCVLLDSATQYYSEYTAASLRAALLLLVLVYVPEADKEAVLPKASRTK